MIIIVSTMSPLNDHYSISSTMSPLNDHYSISSTMSPLNDQYSISSTMSPLNDHYSISLPNNNCCIFTSNITSRANSDSSRLNVNAQPFLPATLNNVSEDEDVYPVLSNLRIKNINKILIAHLNINSLRYKFDMLSDIITGKIDIILISETKLDNTFPLSNFKIHGFCTPFRRDRTRYGGGILLWEDIPLHFFLVCPFPKMWNAFSFRLS